jgi:pimeloyl-ACP methyl ester carboxylesterase
MKRLFFLLWVVFSNTHLFAKEVHFTTSDNAQIYAKLQQRGSHAVLLAHGAIFNKESWGKFAQSLLAENYTVLAIDFRGYGKSTQGSKVGALYEDILAGIRYLKANPNFDKITVLGASMGGAAAAKASVKVEENSIDQLILLSPANIYQPEKLQGQLLFIASKGEYLVPALQAAFAKAPHPKELQLITGSAHAQHIFKTTQAATLTRVILQFLQQAS